MNINVSESPIQNRVSPRIRPMRGIIRTRRRIVLTEMERIPFRIEIFNDDAAGSEIEDKIYNQAKKVTNYLKKVRTTTISQNLMCTICQENCLECEEISKLECLHYFHEECLKEWLILKKACPNCRNVVEYQQKYYTGVGNK